MNIDYLEDKLTKIIRYGFSGLGFGAALTGIGLGMKCHFSEVYEGKMTQEAASIDSKMKEKVRAKKEKAEEALAERTPRTPLEKVLQKTKLEEEEFMNLPLEKVYTLSFEEYYQGFVAENKRYSAIGIEGCLKSKDGKSYLKAPARTEAVVEFRPYSKGCGFGTALVPRGK